MSRPARLLALLAAAVLLGAGMLESWRGLAVSNRQKQRNLDSWNAFDDAERDDWREAFDGFQALPRDEQSRIYRRHAALNRLRQDILRSLGRSPTRAELLEQLAGLPARMGYELDMPAADREAVNAALTEGIAASLGAFLDNLVRASVLTEGERGDLAGLAFEERLEEGLALQKRQEIYLFVERHAPDETHELDPSRGEELLELRDLDPLDVTERLRRLRQNQGLLGRAGRMLALSEAEMDELAAAPADEVMDVLARLYRPRVRLLLHERGKEPEVIDQFLRLPPRQLERVLNRLLLEQP